MGNVLSYRVFKNLCCKSFEFSEKENQEKSYRLMNKERQEQTRALFHFFLCEVWIFFELISSLLLLIYICFLCSTHLWPTFQSHILRKHPRTKCSPAHPEGINWKNHQPNEIIINWPIHDQYPYFTPPGSTRKPKALQHFQGDTKPENQQEKSQVTR